MPQTLNIACICADLLPERQGGAEVHAVEVIKLLSLKHKITVFVGRDTTVTTLFNQNVTVVPINYPRIPNFVGLSYILFGYPKILAYINSQTVKPNLIWAKQSFPQAVIAARLKKVLKIPLYITAQNPRLLHDELVVSDILKPFQHVLASLLDFLIVWAYKQADTVAVVSKYSGKLAKIYRARHVVVIPNGISPGKFKLKRQKPVVFTLVTTSSLIPRNGIDTLIAAMKYLPPEESCELLIAGDGPLFQSLKNQAKKLKIGGWIKFLGRVPNTKIPDLVSSAHLFVRPSRWEGFGISFLEAMASGVPVIATPVGGIPDFITHRETGFLVKPNQPEELATAIMTLRKDRDLYSHLVKNGLELSRKKYAWPVIVKQIENEMLRLVDK